MESDEPKIFVKDGVKNYIFEDDRLYQPWGLLHPKKADSKEIQDFLRNYAPKKYRLDDETEFWFDGQLSRVATSDPNFFLQVIRSNDFANAQRRIYVSIGGRRVQFSKKHNEPIAWVPFDSDGQRTWLVEEIGSPLLFHTVFEDERQGIKRQVFERHQCLTNAEGFKNSYDVEKAIALITVAFSTFGNLFGSDPVFGREKPGRECVEFSEDVLRKIERGDYVKT